MIPLCLMGSIWRAREIVNILAGRIDHCFGLRFISRFLLYMIDNPLDAFSMNFFFYIKKKVREIEKSVLPLEGIFRIPFLLLFSLFKHCLFSQKSVISLPGTSH